MKLVPTSLLNRALGVMRRAGKGGPVKPHGKGGPVHPSGKGRSFGTDQLSTGKGGPTHPNLAAPRMVRAGKGGPTHPIVARSSGKGGPVKPSSTKPSVYVMGSSSDILDALQDWNISMGGR